MQIKNLSKNHANVPAGMKKALLASMSLPPRSQSSFGSVSKSHAMAIQFIQNDLSKMRARISEIDELCGRAVPMVPPQLATTISDISARVRTITTTHNSIDHFKLSARADRLSDSVSNLAERIQAHLNVDPNFNPSKAYASSFAEDVISRILGGTRRRLTAFVHSVDRRIHALPREERAAPFFITEAPQLETPRRATVVEKRRPPDAEATIAILSSIKDQTERLRVLYSGLTRGREAPDREYVPAEIVGAVATAESDRVALLGQLMAAKVSEARRGIERAPLETEFGEPLQPELIAPQALADFRTAAAQMSAQAAKAIADARKDITHEISVLRGRLDLIEQRLDQFADFSGDSHDFLTYVGMKIEDVGRDDTVGRGRDGSTERIAAERYLRADYVIEEAAEREFVAELRKRLAKLEFSRPVYAA
jgi:hypothetical protein